MRPARALLGLGVLLCLWACSRDRGAANEARSDASSSSAASAGGKAPSSASKPAASASSSSASASSHSFELRVEDGGASTCRILRSPVRLPLRGAVSLRVGLDAVDAILDDDGRPRVTTFLAGPIAARVSHDADASSDEPPGRALAIACAPAGDRAFCPDRSGEIHRISLQGGDDRVVANSRSGTRVAAASFGESHVALGYLASRQTSEGWVSEAWLAVDDDRPVRVSEDGSGATSIALAARGPTLLVLTVDARTALTAMHARLVTRAPDLHLGEDVVAFVGGPGDRRTAAALALPAAGPAWGLLPISKDIGDFGLAIVKLDDPPRVDEPVIWAMYPNGLDPAPVAAAVGHGSTWVVRVRPATSEVGAARELELGELGDDGFLPKTVLSTTGSPTDAAIAVDVLGGLWIAWLDAAGSWLTRIACR